MSIPLNKRNRVKNINVNVNINKNRNEEAADLVPGLSDIPAIISKIRPQLEEVSPEIAKLAENLSNAITGLNE
ncbi:MAG: hypothetical protein ACOX8I_10715 [Bacillota bacterium]